MNAFKNILIFLGALLLVVLILLIVFGIKVIGTLLGWIMGFLIIVFLVGWVIYLVGKARGSRG